MRFLYFILNIAFVGLSLVAGAQDTVVNKLKLNGRYNDFAPVIYKSGLVFCSDRPSQLGVSRVDAQDNHLTKIYYAKNINDRNVELLSENINSKDNEGPGCFSPDGRQFFYTGAIQSKDKRSVARLGLFISSVENGNFSEPIPFEYNSPDGSYSLAHPSVSHDGKRLYFSSDMPGGYGGKDLYYSEWINGKWVQPVNLGSEINSPSDELFPHISSDNKLYFSSNRAGDSTGLDLYVYSLSNPTVPPKRMPVPINSDEDDFALVMNADNSSGYFSSGRNGGKDNIYSFSINYPEFMGCPEAELPTFCYYFEETNIIPNDTLPLIFEWEFGDGTTYRGITAEHCFTDFGTYHVALNIYDSLTRVQFGKVSEVDIVIERSPFPYIESLDRLSTPGIIEFSAKGTDITNFTAEEYYWNSGNGQHSKGYNTAFTYDTDGIYTVELGILGRNLNGEQEKRCATKRIRIGEIPVGDEEPVKQSALQEEMVFVDGDKLTPTTDSTVYYVEFKKSGAPIAANDNYFDNIKYEISERFDEKKVVYRYSVGGTSDMTKLIAIYRDLISHGYTESMVRQEKTEAFQKSTVKAWWFIPDSINKSINLHINKFSDIHFDLGTYTIRQESFDNLNYISEVLNSEKSLRLKIHAHTDNIGSDENNLVLSEKRAESVIDYLNKRGVALDRLEAIGHGAKNPIAPNNTERGRAQNRRVEFEILFQ